MPLSSMPMPLLLVAVLVACRSNAVPPPVLTLLPAAFEGGLVRAGERCLRPGDEAAAAVYVHEASVTFTVRARAEGGAVLDVALGSETLAAQEAGQGEALELTYRARPPRGLQALHLSLPRGAGGEVCIAQVALTQP